MIKEFNDVKSFSDMKLQTFNDTKVQMINNVKVHDNVLVCDGIANINAYLSDITNVQQNERKNVLQCVGTNI